MRDRRLALAAAATVFLFIIVLFVPCARGASRASKRGAEDPYGWYWQNPLPQGNGLSAVSALDSAGAL